MERQRSRSSGNASSGKENSDSPKGKRKGKGNGKGKGRGNGQSAKFKAGKGMGKDKNGKGIGKCRPTKGKDSVGGLGQIKRFAPFFGGIDADALTYVFEIEHRKGGGDVIRTHELQPVSYTHLTLPTILRV